jgi:hypothetical protein
MTRSGATHRRGLFRGPGHDPGHPADRGDQLGDRVLGRHRIGQDRGIHRPPPAAFQHPRLRDHRRHRVTDPVRPLRLRQAAPPVHQRRGIEPAMIEGEPARCLPPQVTAGRLGRFGVGVIVQDLQNQHRRHHARRDRRPAPPRREQIREIGVGEQLTAVLRQEREHAPGRDQMPHQRLRVQQLPVHPLSALHYTIIPGHRTHCRQNAVHTPALFSALLGDGYAAGLLKLCRDGGI